MNLGESVHKFEKNLSLRVVQLNFIFVLLLLLPCFRVSHSTAFKTTVHRCGLLSSENGLFSRDRLLPLFTQTEHPKKDIEQNFQNVTINVAQSLENCCNLEELKFVQLR